VADTPLPPARVLEAAPQWRAIDFISDLHLASDTPRTFEAFTEFLRCTAADAVLILGDLFEVWVGDDARDEAFEHRCVESIAETSKRIAVGFMAGNRDFLVGPTMLAACGAFELHDPTLLAAFGMRVLLTHGDALCLADTAYQAFRAEVRGVAWRRDFLARPLAERRTLARAFRDASEQRRRAAPMGEWADLDLGAARRSLGDARSLLLVHGHTHQPASEAIGAGCTRYVLSDWDLDHASPVRAEVLRFSAAGLERLSPAQACA
jgi:UDP-2,3-diacylglucosamine hydrolase